MSDQASEHGFLPLSVAGKERRIACYGFVSRQSGSGSSAMSLVLEELLRRKYRVDFYAIEGFVYPEELFAYKQFHYIPVRIDVDIYLHRIVRMFPKGLREIAGFGVNILASKLYYRRIAKLVAARHASYPYDLMLFLGLAAPFRIDGLPMVSWLQTPPQTEDQAITAQRQKIVELCGLGEYLKLKLYYQYKRWLAQGEMRCSDLYICGSRWSVEGLVAYGVPRRSARPLSMPVDLDQFSPGSEQRRASSVKTFLHLGRLVPRKRLDLLLDGFALLLEERQDVRLQIVGSFFYAKGYRHLLDNPRLQPYIEYSEGIERARVPELMRSIDFVIQTSESENFGTTVAEALCCGVPVIVGPTNGTRDYLGLSAFEFEEYTPAAVKEAMVRAIRAMEDDGEGDLGRRARQAAETHFSDASVVDGLEDIFAEARRCFAQ